MDPDAPTLQPGVATRPGLKLFQDISNVGQRRGKQAPHKAAATGQNQKQLKLLAGKFRLRTLQAPQHTIES